MDAASAQLFAHVAQCDDACCSSTECARTRTALAIWKACPYRDAVRCGHALCPHMHCFVHAHAQTCTLPFGKCRIPTCDRMRARIKRTAPASSRAADRDASEISALIASLGQAIDEELEAAAWKAKATDSAHGELLDAIVAIGDEGWAISRKETSTSKPSLDKDWVIRREEANAPELSLDAIMTAGDEDWAIRWEEANVPSAALT